MSRAVTHPFCTCPKRLKLITRERAESRRGTVRIAPLIIRHSRRSFEKRGCLKRRGKRRTSPLNALISPARTIAASFCAEITVTCVTYPRINAKRHVDWPFLSLAGLFVHASSGAQGGFRRDSSCSRWRDSVGDSVTNLR